jgi:hypothetical protein
MHTYIPATGEEAAVALAEFPICPLHVPARAVPYREMLAAFATLSGVDLAGLQWKDPPDLEGGPDEH